MDYLWAGMILLGILYGSLTGQSQVMTKNILDAAGEAVSLCITMTGVLSFWMGFLNVARKAGLLDGMTKMLQPLVGFLFPRLPKDHPARVHISTNLVANILGLGWACTPAGLKAMEELSHLEEERRKGHSREERAVGEASDEMCDFLILNISSLQLIPVNIIAYRMQYGSVDPAKVIVPAIIATTISTLTAILYIKYQHGKTRRKGGID